LRINLKIRLGEIPQPDFPQGQFNDDTKTPEKLYCGKHHSHIALVRDIFHLPLHQDFLYQFIFLEGFVQAYEVHWIRKFQRLGQGPDHLESIGKQLVLSRLGYNHHLWILDFLRYRHGKKTIW
jgi:hypothetical protein